MRQHCADHFTEDAAFTFSVPASSLDSGAYKVTREWSSEARARGFRSLAGQAIAASAACHCESGLAQVILGGNRVAHREAMGPAGENHDLQSACQSRLLRIVSE
jgi:hypothetical protein